MEIKHVECCILNRYFKCVWMFFLNDCIIWKSNCRHFVAIVADKSAEVKMVCDLCEFNRVAEYANISMLVCPDIVTLYAVHVGYCICAVSAVVDATYCICTWSYGNINVSFLFRLLLMYALSDRCAAYIFLAVWHLFYLCLVTLSVCGLIFATDCWFLSTKVDMCA